MTRYRTVRSAQVAACASVALVLASCGGGGSDENAADSGELRTFTYEDTIDESIMGPFEEANPNLEVQTATFESLDEAAAKITSGFGTDVIEVCLDESQPLLQADLLAPIDTSRISSWDDLFPLFTEADGVNVDGNVMMVPTSAGPHGIIYSPEAFPDGVDSYRALFDPANKGRVALDGGWLTAIADTAMALNVEDPMTMTDDQVEQAKNQLLVALADGQFRTIAQSDSDMANLFKSGEVVLADGGRGTAQEINDNGGSVVWVAPQEGALSWICGLGISSEAENVDAAYAFLDYYVGQQAQAVVGDLGYVIANQTALQDVTEENREMADPSALEGSIPMVEPENADVWRAAWQEVQAGG